jgi:hypothetical protein
VVGAALILLPLTPIEIADNGVNSPWYALVARAAGAPATGRTATVARARGHGRLAGGPAGPGAGGPGELRRANSAPWQAGKARPVAAVNGATVIVCAILAAGLCWALVTGTRHSRVFIAVALIMGFVEAVFAATVVAAVTAEPYFFDYEGGSRYSTMPIMGITAAAVVAVDAYWRRQAGGELAEVEVPRGERAGRIPHRYAATERMAWGHWQPKAERLLTACEHSTSEEITTWAWGKGTITVPCSRLRR